MAKRRKTRKAKQIEPPSSNSEEDIDCRCICGSNDPNAKRPWIQCVACTAWQHNECMDQSVFSDELGLDYVCEDCWPEAHKKLLDEVEKGEKPWETRVADRVAVKKRFENAVLAAVEKAEWFWPAYRPKVVLSGTDDDSRGKVPDPPDDFLYALERALRLLFDELPLKDLRDLAAQCDGLKDSILSAQAVRKRTRKKAAPLFTAEDAGELGVLAEIFRWAEKGAYWEGWEGVLEKAREGVERVVDSGYVDLT